MAGRTPEDLTGRRFGKWTVLKLDHHNTRPRSRWICRCDCGRVFPVYATNLKSGHSKSCGCNDNRDRNLRPKEIKLYGLSTHEIGFIKMKLRSETDDLQLEEVYRDYY